MYNIFCQLSSILLFSPLWFSLSCNRFLILHTLMMCPTLASLWLITVVCPTCWSFFHPKSLSTILAHSSLTIVVALPMTYFISTNNVNHHTSSISHHSIVPLLGLYISHSLLLFIVYLWIVCVKPYFGPLFFCLVSPSSLFSLHVFSFPCIAFPRETH